MSSQLQIFFEIQSFNILKKKSFFFSKFASAGQAAFKDKIWGHGGKLLELAQKSLGNVETLAKKAEWKKQNEAKPKSDTVCLIIHVRAWEIEIHFSAASQNRGREPTLK
jgi:hypothetical protein